MFIWGTVKVRRIGANRTSGKEKRGGIHAPEICNVRARDLRGFRDGAGLTLIETTSAKNAFLVSEVQNGAQPILQPVQS
jgi:hypothetical protein